MIMNMMWIGNYELKIDIGSQFGRKEFKTFDQN